MGLVFIATLLLLFASLIFKKNKKMFWYILFFVISLYIIALSLNYYNEHYLENVLEEPTFSENIEHFTFSLGAKGLVFGYSKEMLKKTHINPAFFHDYQPFTLYVEKDKLYVDVAIYRGDGFPPIEIKRNKLFNKPNNWDFNSNSYAMEIINEKKLPVYQLFYKNPSHIVIHGIFPLPDRNLLLIDESGATTFHQIIPNYFKLKRIFRYPSWKHPGELDN